jgi:hypothetical protein
MLHRYTDRAYEKLPQPLEEESCGRSSVRFLYTDRYQEKSPDEETPLLLKEKSDSIGSSVRSLDSNKEDSIGSNRSSDKVENKIELAQSDIASKSNDVRASQGDTDRVITFQATEDFDRLLSGGLSALYEKFKTPYKVLQVYRSFVEEIETVLEQEKLDPDAFHINGNGQIIHVVKRQEEVNDEQRQVDGGIADDVKLMNYFGKRNFSDVIKELTAPNAGPGEQEHFKLLVDRTTAYLKELWEIAEENMLKLIREVERKYRSEPEEKRIAFEYYKRQAEKRIALDSPTDSPCIPYMETPCKRIKGLKYRFSWKYNRECRRYKWLVTEDFGKHEEELERLKKKYGDQIYGFGKSKGRQEVLYKTITAKKAREQTEALEYRSLTAKCLAQLSIDIKVYKVLRADCDKFLEGIGAEKQKKCKELTQKFDEKLKSVEDEQTVKGLKELFDKFLTTKIEEMDNEANKLKHEYVSQVLESFKSILNYEASEGARSDITQQSADLQMQNKLNEIRQKKISKMLENGSYDVVANNGANAMGISLGTGGLSVGLLSTIHASSAAMTAAALSGAVGVMGAATVIGATITR